VADFSRITEHDIELGLNVLQTPYGPVAVETPCGYAVLEPRGGTQAIASLGDETVAVRTSDGRFTWYGLTLSAGFGDVGSPALTLGIVGEAGITAPVETEGDKVVPVVRRSRLGGWLVFVFNLERKAAELTLHPRWRTGQARDLLTDTELPVTGGAFPLAVEKWGVAVVHCAEL